jgi:hypothetical protein
MARTPVAPVAVGAAVAGGLLAAVAGAPPAAAALVGVLCGAGGLAALLPRARKERIDPFTVQEPWRTMVQRAQSAGRRFEEAVGRTRPGPLRDTLADLGRRVDVAVQECWEIAKRGHDLDRGVSRLDVAGVSGRLARLDDEPGGGGGGDVEATREALRSQLGAAERLAAVAEDARTRLRLLNAQMDEAVARAVELSLSAGDTTALGSLGGEVDSLVLQLEALHQALRETGGAHS